MPSDETLSRRESFPVLGALGAGFGTVFGKSAPAQGLAVAEPLAAAAEAAIKRLKEGNERFVRGSLVREHSSPEWRMKLASGQRPFATILSCSDSRVPPELIFDQGFGDLFIVRVAGNLISNEVLGSMEYAEHHLHSPLFVVMGHQSCGAVAAAVEHLLGGPKQSEYVQSLVRAIMPGLKHLDRGMRREALLAAAIEENVRWSIEQFTRVPAIRRAKEAKRIGVVGAVYDLQTGHVRFL